MMFQVCNLPAGLSTPELLHLHTAMPTKSLRSKKAQSNAGQQLKVQQLLIPEIEQLQQQELQAQAPLSINKPARQTPRQQVKPQIKPSVKTKQKKTANRLEEPYKQPPAKPATLAKSRTITFGNTTLVLPRDQHKLEAMKKEAVEYWKNLPEIT